MFPVSGAHNSTRHRRDGDAHPPREGEILPHRDRREGALPQPARCLFQGALGGDPGLQRGTPK